MVRIRLGILMVAMLSSAYAGIYRSVDANGVVHFDDQSSPGSTEVHLHEVQTYQAPTPPTSTSTPQPPPVVVKRYKTVVITQPSDKNTVRNNDGSLAVSVELEPQLQAHHKVQIVLDGQPAGEAQAATTFSLKDIYRGTHTVSATVVDGAGATIGESASVTFTMHRPLTDKPMGTEAGKPNPPTR
jgi:Domain of unknown function (DUF4124)